jgi:hypothetical protein
VRRGPWSASRATTRAWINAGKLAAVRPERIGDSVADEAVLIEPVSGVKFPVKQGKNREFVRFWPLLNCSRPEKPFVYLINQTKFPTQRNSEFFWANRELFSRIREFADRNRESAFFVEKVKTRM